MTIKAVSRIKIAFPESMIEYCNLACMPVNRSASTPTTSPRKFTGVAGEAARPIKNGQRKAGMAMVQAIVHQSLRSAGTLAEARESVVSRFETLTHAQDMLTRLDWRLTNLGDVAQSALGTVNQDGRLTIEGPLVEIGARAALSLTLVLHELATNALKYGALSAPDGRVKVRWRLSPADADNHVAFTWNELGGPVVSPPVRKGFGTRLIDTMGRNFGGRNELCYNP